MKIDNPHGSDRDWNNSADVQFALADLESTDARKRARAVLTIGKVCGATSGLIRIAREDPSADVRLMAVVRLGKDHLDVLVECLTDPCEKIVCYACGVISYCGDSTFVKFLEPLQQHTMWRIRFDACEAMFRLGRADQQLESVLRLLAHDEESLEHEESILHLRELDGTASNSSVIRRLTLNELMQAVRERLASASR